LSLQRFEGASIEAVLEEARAKAGPDVRIIEANKVRRGGIGGFFAKERFEVAIELTAADPVLDLADRVDDTTSLSTEQDAFAELLGRMARDTGDDDPPSSFVPAVPERRPPGDPALVRLGLPAAIVPATGDPVASLMEALRSLPVAAPVPAAPGAVVVVVGERDHALALARDLASELGIAEDEVALAAEGDGGEGVAPGCLLPTVPAVVDERCSARWRRRPSIVALAAPVRPRSTTFCRRALEALEPTTTWAAVSASAKPEDVMAWSESLGGVDALAIDGVDDTSSPASVLGTGIPVARLDGRPASAALWTALLLERLAS
jgi:hypothetical protein